MKKTVKNSKNSTYIKSKNFSKSFIFVVMILSFGIVGTGLYSFFTHNNQSINTSSAQVNSTTFAFDTPNFVEMRKSPKKVFAHYFTPYPIRLTASGDYYETAYLNPYGEGNKHVSYGGFLRDKPLFYGTGTPEQVEAKRTTYESGTYKDVPLYLFNDMKQEVLRATEAGIDGFTVDMLSLDTSKNSSGQYNNSNFMRMNALLHAVDWYNGLPEQVSSNHMSDFKIMLMPDATITAFKVTITDKGDSTTLAVGSQYAETTVLSANSSLISSGKTPAKYTYVDSGVSQKLAIAVDELADKFPNAMHKVNNQIAISPFDPEERPPSFWSNWLTLMKNNYGKDIAFIPCFQNLNSTSVNNYKTFSYGWAEWNTSRSSTTLEAHGQLANSTGKIWMQGHAYQDTRPKSYRYWENRNTEVFRQSWSVANNYADWVQLVTWNDYSENTQLTASRSLGYNLLDLNLYYSIGFKTGSYPIIKRDNIYISHRKHLSSAKPNGTIAGYTKFMYPWYTVNPSDTKVTPRDKVEIITMLKEPGIVDVNIGTTSYSINAPAGVNYYLYDLKEGTISATLKRNNNQVASIISPTKVSNNFAIQDMNYQLFSARRDGTVNDSQVQALPDLVVNNITWTPIGPKPGDQVVFSAEIQNIGNAPTTNGIKHGVSFWVNGTQVSWSDDSTIALAPGEKRTITSNGGLDGNNNWIPASEGSYTVEARVDDINRIVETNESNQRFSKAIYVNTNLIKGDINSNNKVDIFDLSVLLTKWNTNDINSDLNNDGSVNVFDLSIMLTNWTI